MKMVAIFTGGENVHCQVGYHLPSCGYLYFFYLIVCLLPCSELADEPVELNGDRDRLTLFVSGNSPLRSAPTMQTNI